MASKEAGKKRYTAVPVKSKVQTKESTAISEAAVAAAPVVPAAATPAQAAKPVETSTAAVATAVAPVVAAPAAVAAKPATAPVAPAPVAATPAVSPVRIGELLVSLHGADADLAREAAMELGASRDTKAVEPLMAVVRNADGYFHSVVRAAASAALGQIGDARAIDVLTAGIADPMAEASAEAVRALAVIAGERAVPALLATVKNADGYYLAVVRRAAVVALGKIGGAAVLAELGRVAIDPAEDTAVRAAAQAATAAK